MTRAGYFLAVLNQMFIGQALISGGKTFFADNIPWPDRLAGDYVIMLAAGAACIETGGLGCVLAGATATAGLDYWQNLDPSVPMGISTGLSEAAKVLFFGLCAGVSDMWELLTGIRPQIGCE